MSGGSLLSNDLRSAVSNMFPPGINLITNWGMTEATCEATQFPLHEIDTEASVGRLMPNMSAKVIDTTGGELGKNEMGELCIKGPNVSRGYFNNPTATADAFTPDGFFKTGDIAIVGDDEKVFIKGRYKELIKYKSNQVPPVELESVILTVPGVQDVGVIGVPQGDGNELPRAYVVRDSSNETCTAEAIEGKIKSTLANHKWLRGGVRWVDEIPRNTIGKIDRKIIKTWCEGEAPILKANL
ncbi:putative acyl-coenzyme A synthetase [Cyphellophora attinorum]|uniref:Putative acyl-coenzyme A synthetase n=1 Tax=Cyphellophora attinorum TaxID=1664694 RepID=A0A0N0NNF9_9EURO|nr:putative acyl-coenzyme A synthetase [Phialophora attinorum]KPI41329.1 putative acyl-coenzyme A synthetase [Phialophora attinorum]